MNSHRGWLLIELQKITGDIPLDKVTTEMVQKLYDKLEIKGDNIANNVCRRDLGELFELAKEMGYVQENVFKYDFRKIFGFTKEEQPCVIMPQ